jgi:hypothetical protein
MRKVQRLMIALAVVAVAGFGSVSGADAKPRPVLKFAPARPTVTTPITVSFKAPKIKRSGVYYGTVLRIGSVSGPECSGLYPRVALRNARGGTFTATLKPRNGDPGAPRWCNGVAQLEVRRYGPGGLFSPIVARRTFPVGTGKDDPTSPAQGAGVPVKITVLGGSTLTASASGRPDRSAQLSGVLRGTIPGRFNPNTDIGVEQISGSLTALGAALAQAVFPPDPLCPDTPPPGTFDALPSSQLLLKASGDGIFNLVLNGAASQLFGCGPAGALSGTTTLPLTGHVGPKGLLEMPEAGAATGIPLPAGSQGGLAANLVLNVDLSGKG